MCLYVNRSIHKGEYPEPLVAKKPIVVYKVLGHKIDGNIVTPYRVKPVRFKNGRAELSIRKDDLAAFRCPRLDSEIEVFDVDEGIHAFTNYQLAKEEKDWQNKWSCLGTVYHVYFSLIPKGHKFFIGDEGDIVATKLIMFESLEGLSKYLNEKKTGKMDVDEVEYNETHK